MQKIPYPRATKQITRFTELNKKKTRPNDNRSKYIERKERKKSFTKRACEGHRVRMGIHSYMGHGYEDEASGVCVATIRHPHLYVMDVLSEAHVVRVMRVCVAVPCCWAACVCAVDESECARWWLAHLGRASTKRFLFVTIPKRRD